MLKICPSVFQVIHVDPTLGTCLPKSIKANIKWSSIATPGSRKIFQKVEMTMVEVNGDNSKIQAYNKINEESRSPTQFDSKTGGCITINH